MDFILEKKLIHDKERVITSFCNKEHISIQDFFNTPNISINEIKDNIDKILSCESSRYEFGNERVYVEIANNSVCFTDLFEGIVSDDELYPRITISIGEFKRLLLNWEEKKYKLCNG